jgi:hypothetical protein
VKHFTHLAVPLLIAAACTGGDQRSPTAPSTSPNARPLLNTSGPTSQASATGVRIVDLGTLPGGWPSYAKAINGGRVIVGVSYTGANFSGVPHAVRWQESTPGSGSWTIQDLSSLITGSVMSEAIAINANGDIAGWMNNAAGEDVSFLLSAGGTLSVVAPPAGKNGTFPYGVNVSGGIQTRPRLASGCEFVSLHPVNAQIALGRGSHFIPPASVSALSARPLSISYQKTEVRS